ncbi:MAG: hypothetical protein AB7H97_08315 [Pseudobdellovibrionaceae bacterium]
MKNIIRSQLVMVIVGSLIFASCAQSDSKGQVAYRKSDVGVSGSETGNGGGVVVCRNASTGAIEKVELLDFYEARVLRNLKINMGAVGDSFQIKVEKTRQKLAKVSPLRAAKYKNMFSKFSSEAVFIPDAELTYIDDAANVVVPVGCKKEQASILNEPEFPGDPRYTISKDLWDRMDNDSKAGLILHEIIYQEGLTFEHVNSKPTRYILGLLASTAIDNLNPEQFAKIVLSSNFKILELFGSLVIKKDEEDSIWYKEDESKFFEEVRPKQVVYEGLTLQPRFSLSFSKSGTLLWAFGVQRVSKAKMDLKAIQGSLAITYSPRGKIEKLKGVLSGRFGDWNLSFMDGEYSETLWLDKDELPFNFDGTLQISNPKTGYISAKVYDDRPGDDDRTISPRGIILRGMVNEPQPLVTPQGLLVFDSKGRSSGVIHYVSFNEDGIVTAGRLAPNQEIKTESGIKKSLNHLEIEFLENGLARIKTYGSQDPDYIRGGCQISDYSSTLLKYLKEEMDLGGYLKSKGIEWDEGSLSVERVADYVLDNDTYKYALPTFAVTFRSKSGNLFLIKTFKDGEGISLEEEAVLRTKRNSEGAVIRKYCEHSFMRENYSSHPIFLNKTLNVDTGIGYYFDLRELAEDHQ